VETVRDDAISLGTHALIVEVKRYCPWPVFWVRVTGDVLVHVPLTENPETRQWYGEFDLPREGSYKMDVRWYGCHRENSTTFHSFEEPLQFAARGVSGSPHERQPHTPPFFAESSAWRRRESIPEFASMASEPLLPFVWMEAKQSTPPEGSLLCTTKTPEVSSCLSTEGTLKHPDDYYKFGQVSNYELVWCVLLSRYINLSALPG
jgi:hypothetical protein